MTTLKFKTNINCGGCKKTVSMFFQKEPRIITWDVDIVDPAKTLTVETDGLSEQDVRVILSKAGFSAQLI